MLRGATSRRRNRLVGRDARERDAARDRDERWDDERCAPTGELNEKAGHRRRQRDAEIAREAVDADRETGTLGAAHEHRNPDGMINRRECAHQRQRQRELPGVLRRRDQQHRSAHAEVKNEHHLAPAPVIAESPGRQRPQAEHYKRAHAVRHQIFPPGDAEIRGDRADRRRKDQQEHVIKRVRYVQ